MARPIRPDAHMDSALAKVRLDLASAGLNPDSLPWTSAGPFLVSSATGRVIGEQPTTYVEMDDNGDPILDQNGKPTTRQHRGYFWRWAHKPPHKEG